MKRFRELPSIHQHLIGLAIVLLMAIMLLVLQPAVSYELVVILGAAGVVWLVVSLTALAIHTKRRSDPLYALLQNAYERAKATNDPRLADYEKRLSELAPDRRYFFGTTDINHGWRWYAFCFTVINILPAWVAFHMLLSSETMRFVDWVSLLLTMGFITFPLTRVFTIFKERDVGGEINNHAGFLDPTYIHDGSGRWDWWLINDRYKGKPWKGLWRWLFNVDE